MTPTADTADAHADQGLPPWQFFLLCGMLGATAVVIVATGQPIANILVLSVTVVAASIAGLAAYRMLAPLVSHTVASAPVVAGGRTRAALEREKTLVLRAIKELEFDFAMRKIAQADFDEMGGRLRRRAMGLIQQLDAHTGYREQIETELATLVTAARTPHAAPGTPHPVPGTPHAAPGTQHPVPGTPHAAPGTQHPVPGTAPRTPHAELSTAPSTRHPAPGTSRSCPTCATSNDLDARFCKQCGTSLTHS